MITWMQKHKKWLVITIWISTIAFVGAGFVGWGSYDYGKSAGSVAVVGDREVSVEEYQREYSGLYEQYQQIFGDQFNQDMAKQLNLSDMAYKLVIQKNLILSYGDELGLDVTNEDIAREVVKMTIFQQNGKFDKPTYVKILTQNRTTPVDFEAGLKRNLLLQKIEKLFQMDASNSEVKNLNQLLFLEDDIEIKILSANDIVVPASEEKMKRFWETNKSKYLTKKSFELETFEVKLLNETPADSEILEFYEKNKNDFKNSDGKLKTLAEAKNEIVKAINMKTTKKEALKKYLKLKKGEDKFTNKVTLDIDKLGFNEEDTKELTGAKRGTLFKPFLVDENYVIVKVLETFNPIPLSYEDAKPNLRVDFEAEAKKMLLSLKATKELDNFKGTKIGYVTRESASKIKGLNSNEATQFLNSLFSQTTKQGKIELDGKVVLYKINDSRFAKYDSSKDLVVKNTLNNLLNGELMTNLVKNLENRYEVQSSMDIKE